MSSEEAPVPLPSLADCAATLMAYADGTGALAVGVLIPQGDDVSPAIVRYDPLESVLTVAEGEELRSVPALDGLGGKVLGPMHLHAFPEFETDVDEGKIIGAIGAMEDLAKTLRTLASYFGTEALASAEFRTKGESEPLEIGASASGDYVVGCGEVEFELPEGWPKA